MKLLIVLLIFLSLIEAKLVIVTNSNSDIGILTKESIKYLYLAKTNKIKNIKIKPLLSKDRNLHKRFINRIIDKNILQYSSYWARLVFTGRKSIPRRLGTEEITQMLKEKNTIIYIEKKDIKKEWKIVYEE